MKIDGKELKISIGSWDECMELQRAIGRAIKGENLEIDMEGIDLSSKKDKDSLLNISKENIGNFLNTILSLGISEEVEKCLFVCLERVMLGEEKVNKSFFEEPNNRQYFYKIAIEVIKVNIIPFYKSLFSGFSAVMEKAKDILGQK